VIPLALVWLRALGLVGQALALGGAAFAFFVLRAERDRAPARSLDWALGVSALGAILVAAAQAGALAAMIAALSDDAGWPTDALLGSTVGIAALIRFATGISVALVALAARRSPTSRTRGIVLLAAAAILCFTGALSSHAAGRVDGRLGLLALSAIHQAAASAWIGGLVCAALLILRSARDLKEDWLRPFSTLAAVAVAALALTGIALAFEWVASPASAIGTSYGAMVLTKIVLFIALLTMGAMNYLALRGHGARLSRRVPRIAGGSDDTLPARSLVLRRRVEVEAGLAIVTLFLAAAIGSAPPAVDVADQRATLQEVLHVMAPGWPRLHAPTIAELNLASGLGDPLAPRSPEDTAWGEFGHNVCGLFVLAMGLLAMLERTGRAPWARHWPLLFIGLTAFLAWNLDPEGWQTGRIGFWEHLLGSEVLQHRILLGLTALLGVAEWRVRSGRNPNSRWRYAFPFVCIVAGTLLLSHPHAVINAKTGFLMEVTHLPMGLVVLAAGWARWLELRLSPPENRLPGRLWAPALALLGLLLVFYREG
jgi:putative copper resistance protein D